MNIKTKERGLFALGIAICAGVAGISVLLEHLIPGGLLGASIIALFMGTIINSFFHPARIKPALKFVSKKILKVAIILLGASLSVGTIMSVGKMTFFVMIFTFLMCFGGGYFVRKIFKLNWKLGNLISAGTGICGFWALAIINSLGWIPVSVSGVMKTTSKFLMVSALAAIGLGTSITDFKKAGLAPMFYGVTIDTLVTLTALGVIWLMGLM